MSQFMPSRPLEPTESALPISVFLEFLRRLHDGPPQHAAAMRVAVAIWQNAVDRGDVAQAQEALEMVRAELDRLIAGLVELQETGRRWSGVPSPTHHQLADAAEAARQWEASCAEPENDSPAPSGRGLGRG